MNSAFVSKLKTQFYLSEKVIIFQSLSLCHGLMATEVPRNILSKHSTSHKQDWNNSCSKMQHNMSKLDSPEDEEAFKEKVVLVWALLCFWVEKREQEWWWVWKSTTSGVEILVRNPILGFEEINFLVGMGNWSNAGVQIASASNILEVLVQLRWTDEIISVLDKERETLW